MILDKNMNNIIENYKIINKKIMFLNKLHRINKYK